DSEERHPRRHDEVQRPDTRSGRRRRGARGADLTMVATGPTTREEIHTDGRPRDRSADPTTTAAVSRRAVGRGQAGAPALQRLVGNRATGRPLRGAQAAIRTGARGLARLGYPLGKALPPGAPTPLKDQPDHREWRKADFHKFWEQEQGRKLTASEKSTID